MEYVTIEGMTACYSYESECFGEYSCWAEITVNGEYHEGDCEDLTEMFDADIYGDEEYSCDGDYDCMDYYEVDGMTSCYEY
jgi:hypothetical protein